MLFFLRKLTEAMILPFGFCGLLVVLAVILRRRRLAVVAILIMLVASESVIGTLLLRPLESYYPAMRVADAPRADAIVMLAGSIVRGRTAPGVQWGNSSNRFFTAAELARAGKARLFIISAGMTPFEGKVLRRVAIQEGIPAAQIVLTPPVATTEEEARAVAKFTGVHSVLLVTSALHMPRSVLLFRSMGLQVYPFPTDQRVPTQMDLTAPEFIPGPAALENSEAALREYYGLLVYRGMLFLHGPHGSAATEAAAVR
jgi:uncharacterized SAM-binding protein YcdF (DUF218 family)